MVRFECVLAACIFVVYALTAAPSVAGGDSGELLAEACHFGTAHPPGYPLFTVVWHYVMLLPGLRPAAWANIATGLCGAVAAATVAFVANDVNGPQCVQCRKHT